MVSPSPGKLAVLAKTCPTAPFGKAQTCGDEILGLHLVKAVVAAIAVTSTTPGRQRQHQIERVDRLAEISTPPPSRA